MSDNIESTAQRMRRMQRSGMSEQTKDGGKVLSDEEHDAIVNAWIERPIEDDPTMTDDEYWRSVEAEREGRGA